jgi:hypothetical protein
VIVEDALAVGDPTAGRSNYLRRYRPADAALTEYLERLAEPGVDLHLGYVGEWHTHPLPLPPSPMDRAAMRTMTRKNRHPVAMVVVARHDDTTVSFHGLLSNPQSMRHRLSGLHVPATIRTG